VSDLLTAKRKVCQLLVNFGSSGNLGFRVLGFVAQAETINAKDAMRIIGLMVLPLTLGALRRPAKIMNFPAEAQLLR
jgi:hypothetical protein